MSKNVKAAIESLKSMDESDINDLRTYVLKLVPSEDTKALLDAIKAEQSARRAAKAAERGKSLASRFGF